jgi:hypothetical protein
MAKVYATQRQQLEEERARLEEEYRRERERELITQMSGGTPEGMAVVAGAAALAPAVDAFARAANHINQQHPSTLDLEATARVTFAGGTGHAFSLRAPGVVYFTAGFASYDSNMFDRVIAYTMGVGLQLPMTRALTIRPLEIGFTLGSIRRLIDEPSTSGGVNLRSGAVYRVAAGLAFALSLGADSTGGFNGYADFGVVWRFDLDQNRKYLIQ